jgi:hypothetical protein
MKDEMKDEKLRLEWQKLIVWTVAILSIIIIRVTIGILWTH